jgi:hypothetical protein
VQVWRGCAADPFDANFPIPACNNVHSTTIITAGGNVTVLAAIKSSGTAGSGFTQISTSSLMNASYKQSSSALTGQVVTETGGSTNSEMIVDVLAGASAPPTLINTINVTASGYLLNFTIPAANAGDILYLMLGEDNVASIGAGGSIGVPLSSTAVGVSPICLIQNNISANFNTTRTGGWTCVDDSVTTASTANYTLTTSLQVNPHNGSSFGSPTWETVFADSDQTHYDYRLAFSSPAKNAASNPGTDPHGRDLIPHFQTNFHGSPTPGTPIPAKAARSDIGPALTGSIGALA